MLDFALLIGAASGIILFLYGMEHFSMEVRHLAGERFHSFLRRATKDRFRTAALGAGVTAIAQSSTAVTVITIGLVDSGLMSFTQSLGIILGAGIGTTLTAQLVAFKLTAMGPLFLLLGFLIGMAGGRFSFAGKPVFYFGLVFFALGLVSQTLEPLKNDPAIIGYLSGLSSVPVAILAGFIVTNIFQSSSVFTGLAVLMTESGLITPAQAIPLVLGANLSTLAPLLASARMGIFARRTAVAQIILNTAAVAMVLPVLPQFIGLVSSIGGSPAQQVANAHTIFNILTTLVLLFFLDHVGRLAMRMVPGKEEELLYRTKALNDALPVSTLEALGQVEEELRNMLSNTEKIASLSFGMLDAYDDRKFKELAKLESINDYLNRRIERAIQELSPRDLDQPQAARLVLLVRMSNVMEQLADVGAGIGYVAKRMHGQGAALSRESMSSLREIHLHVRDDLRLIHARLPHISKEDVATMRKNEVAMRGLVNSAYSDRMKRLRKSKVSAGGIFVKVVSRLEASHAKLREIRKLEEMYPAEKN